MPLSSQITDRPDKMSRPYNRRRHPIIQTAAGFLRSLRLFAYDRRMAVFSLPGLHKMNVSGSFKVLKNGF